MKYRALQILGPAAQLAGDGRDDAAKSGQSTYEPVGDAYGDVWSDSNFHRLERWPRQAVNRVKHQQHPNAESQIERVDVGQQHHSDWDADRCAK